MSKRKWTNGLPAKHRGDPRKGETISVAEYQHEIKRLKMENELLRDFLRFTGRKWDRW